MKKDNIKEIRICLNIIAVFSFILMACDRVEGNSENQALTEMTSYIPKNTQGTFFEDIRIAVGNIWQEEYIADNGELQQGITCGLWFFAKHDSSQSRHVRVYPGKKVLSDDYIIEAVDIGGGERELCLRLSRWA